MRPKDNFLLQKSFPQKTNFSCGAKKGGVTFFGPDSKTLSLEMFSLNRLPTPEAGEDVGWDRFLKAPIICSYTCYVCCGGLSSQRKTEEH